MSTRRLQRALSSSSSPALVRRLCTGCLAHIEREETELLALAAERLDRVTLATIGAEMAQRGVPTPAPAALSSQRAV